MDKTFNKTQQFDLTVSHWHIQPVLQILGPMSKPFKTGNDFVHNLSKIIY